MSTPVPTCRIRLGLAFKASVAFCMIATSFFIIRVVERPPPSSVIMTDEEYLVDGATEEHQNLRARNSLRRQQKLDDVMLDFRAPRVTEPAAAVQYNQFDRSTPPLLLPSTQNRRLSRVRDICYDRLSLALGAVRNRNVQPEVDNVFPEPDWKEMYVDDRRRYMYCLVSKVACTSWKRTLLMMSGLVQSTTSYKTMADLPVGFVHNYAYSDRYLRRMVHFDGAEAKYRLFNYYKFMFVRDPMERLVSAYRDKILTDSSYHVNEQIVRTYRYAGVKNKTDLSIRQSGENATFTEFVQYVLDQRSARKPLDRHWAPQSELCSPCRIRYDFVGHYETLQEDAAVVVDYLRTRAVPPLGFGDNSSADANNVRFPTDDIHSHGSPGPPGRSKSGKFVEKMLAELDDSKLREIVELYSDDYDLFDYSRPLRTTTSNDRSETVDDVTDRKQSIASLPTKNYRDRVKLFEKGQKLIP